jgi:uncharacterized membrane protein
MFIKCESIYNNLFLYIFVNGFIYNKNLDALV